MLVTHWSGKDETKGKTGRAQQPPKVSCPPQG